jgi:hypothetical protein
VGRACGCVCLVIASQGLIRFDSDLYAHRAEVGSTPKLRSRAREMLTQLATDAMLRPSLLVFARARLAPPLRYGPKLALILLLPASSKIPQPDSLPSS